LAVYNGLGGESLAYIENQPPGQGAFLFWRVETMENYPDSEPHMFDPTQPAATHTASGFRRQFVVFIRALSIAIC